MRPGAGQGHGGRRSRGRNGSGRGTGADLRAAAGGRDRCTGGMRAGRRSGPGDGGRPVSGGCARGCRCAGGRAGRSRGNVRDVKDGSGGIRAKRRCPARSRGNAGGGARRSVREQPDRAGRSGRDPRFGRDGPAAGLRRGNGDHETRFPWRDPGCRPEETHDLAGAAPGAGGPRPAVQVSRVPESPLRLAPRPALGGRRGHCARQPGATVSPPPSDGS